MEDEEVDGLITELRAMLDSNGFGWALEQAEEVPNPSWPRRRLALALIAAAETVSVGLAQAELSMVESFGKDVEFRPANDDDLGPDAFDADGGSETFQLRSSEQLRGSPRLQALTDLAALHTKFEELRGRLDD